MKNLRKNSGFTLMECVVAMAVLVVMTLGLLMILNVTVRQRNQNTQLERNVDKQVEDVVNDNLSESQSIAGGDIDFGGGIVISGAKMEYNDEGEVQIGALKYDVSYVPVDPDDGDGDDGDDDDDEDLQPSSIYKVYGASEIQNDVVSINEQDTPPVDNGDGTYTVTWRATFTVEGTVSTEKSVKIVYPGSKIVDYDVASGNCKNIHKLGSNTVRIEPGGTGTMKVDVQFLIPKDDYSGTLIEDHFGDTSSPEINAK